MENTRTSIPEEIIFNRLTIASKLSGLLLQAHYSFLFTSLFTFSFFPYTYIQIQLSSSSVLNPFQLDVAQWQHIFLGGGVTCFFSSGRTQGVKQSYSLVHLVYLVWCLFARFLWINHYGHKTTRRFHQSAFCHLEQSIDPVPSFSPPYPHRLPFHTFSFRYIIVFVSNRIQQISETVHILRGLWMSWCFSDF